MSSLENELRQAISGEVHFDRITRRAYSVDASIYEIEPLGVVVPKNREDVIRSLKIAFQHSIPITGRGAATGITGGCIGPGLIVDLSKYLNRIIEINEEEEYAICEPGVIQDELNAQLSTKGFRLGPDTSTGNRATLGGMLANNAAGARSLRYGKMVDHVEEVTLALSDGELITLKALTETEQLHKRTLQTREGDIYRSIFSLQEEYRDEIQKHFPKLPRRVSGYNLDELLTTPLNLAKIIAGSEGTLGIALEIKIKISRKPKVTGLCLIHCEDMLPPLHHVTSMLSHHPLSLEMIDSKIITAGRTHPAIRNHLGWLNGDPAALFIAEFDAETETLVKEKLLQFTSHMKQLNVGYAYVELTDPALMNHVWELRKAGLGLLLSKRTYSRAIAFIEDISVPPETLAVFMEQFVLCLKKYHKEAGIYGHVGAGCLHIRPYINLNSPEEQQCMENIMHDVANLLLTYRGAMSGEHGDGYIRSWLNEKMFGSRLYQAFRQVKYAFDPFNRMNPGKIVDGLPLLHDLRSDTKGTPSPIPTFLNFSDEGGFELATDLCNGNGLCRKNEGVMCPSFQATRDEYDTTRARAQALRGIIHGHLPQKTLQDRSLYEVLDLCLQCKGCKSECPSQVDMAKMKSEILYQYHQKHRRSLRSFLFGHLGTLNQWLSPFASLINRFGNSKLSQKFLHWIGCATQRTLPTLATTRFSQIHREPTHHFKKQVVLFNDTYTEFNHPEIGIAAIKVLNALNYDVIVLPWRCCGRTLYSKGMLPQAKKKASRVIDSFFPYAEKEIPILVLEPSCLSMLSDDYHGLLGENQKLRKVQSLWISFDEFLQQHLKEGKLPISLKETPFHVLLHVHCHEKSMHGTSTPFKVLNGIPGCQVQLIESGCCGMAGAFGYEQEHYDLSMKIGNLKLFPTIMQAVHKNPDVQIIANGISCRQQITHGTNQKIFHLAEMIANRLKD